MPMGRMQVQQHGGAERSVGIVVSSCDGRCGKEHKLNQCPEIRRCESNERAVWYEHGHGDGKGSFAAGEPGKQQRNYAGKRADMHAGNGQKVRDAGLGEVFAVVFAQLTAVTDQECTRQRRILWEQAFDAGTQAILKQLQAVRETVGLADKAGFLNFCRSITGKPNSPEVVLEGKLTGIAAGVGLPEMRFAANGLSDGDILQKCCVAAKIQTEFVILRLTVDADFIDYAYAALGIAPVFRHGYDPAAELHRIFGFYNRYGIPCMGKAECAEGQHGEYDQQRYPALGISSDEWYGQQK